MTKTQTQVARFNPAPCLLSASSPKMEEKPDGQFVAFSEFEAFKKRVDDLTELAAYAYELATYANQSLLTNQPEFLDGLDNRFDLFVDCYVSVFCGMYGNHCPTEAAAQVAREADEAMRKAS